MAERSEPVESAFVSTSCTFPNTTAWTATTGCCPTPTAEAEATSNTGAAFPFGSELVRSTTHTPTPSEETVPLSASAGRPGGGLTVTVIPSASDVAGGGSTRRPTDSGTPVVSISSATLDDVVEIACASAPSTSVMSLCTANERVAATSATPATIVVACVARWIRSLRTRVACTACTTCCCNLGTSLERHRVRGALQGEAAFGDAGPNRNLRTHGRRLYPTLNL